MSATVVKRRLTFAKVKGLRRTFEKYETRALHRWNFRLHIANNQICFHKLNVCKKVNVCKKTLCTKNENKFSSFDDFPNSFAVFPEQLQLGMFTGRVHFVRWKSATEL